jgi:hypothetical protein
MSARLTQKKIWRRKRGSEGNEGREREKEGVKKWGR